MSLLVLWKNNPEQIRGYALRQIVAIAGDGRIADGSDCSAEIRQFLTEVDPDTLDEFARECLEEKFENSGFILQDIINEVGRRLEFNVQPGLYRGRKGSVGFDGIWNGGEHLEFVVEVKTTDTYNVNLGQIERYRKELVSSGRLSEESSIIFVVGRQDTGALEAQIRGSPYAWTMRVIGAASLTRLMKTKVKADSNSVVSRIKALLRPVEYTRVDGIVDLMFDAAEEVSVLDVEAEVHSEETDTDAGVSEPIRKRAGSGAASAGIDELRQKAAVLISEKLKVHLLQHRRSLFATSDGDTRVIVSVSKRYDREYQPYWYGFYDTQSRWLDECSHGYLALGTLDTQRIYLLPFEFLRPLLLRMKTTRREEGQVYWHIALKLADGCCLLVVPGEELDISEYEINV